MRSSNLLVLAAAAIGFTASLTASAEMRLHWHWESSGSSGSPGGVTYYVVVDGWRDDGTGSSAGKRFPVGGKTGGSASSDGKIDGPGTPGKGCTMPKNIPGYRGLPATAKTWPYWIDPSTVKVMQSAFRDNFDKINRDQQARGSSFRFVEASSMNAAHLFIAPPRFGIGTRLHEGDIARTEIRANRDGSIRTTWTVVDNAPITKALADTAAAHEIGHTVGLDDDPGVANPSGYAPDTNYPTVMFLAPGEIAGQKIDPCTLAGIDANVNQEPLHEK